MFQHYYFRLNSFRPSQVVVVVDDDGDYSAVDIVDPGVQIVAAHGGVNCLLVGYIVVGGAIVVGGGGDWWYYVNGVGFVGY